MATLPGRALAGINAALTVVFDAVFLLLGALPPLAGLLLVSLITSVVMLFVVARTSNQSAMAATKRAMHAGLFEIRLFNDDLVAILRALAEVLRQNGRYLLLSLVPLLWMIVPLVLAIAQLQAFYGYEGLEIGAPVLVKVERRGDVAGGGNTRAGGSAAPIGLEAPPEIRVDAGPVELVGSNEVLWRIIPTAAGDFTLTVRAGGLAATKTVHVGDGVVRRSPVRASHGLVDQLLFPSEPPLDDDSPVTSITLGYPEPGLDVLGVRVHWLIVFFVVSMAGAFVLARRFGVTL
ncbi:MAG: hypothetical protein AB7Q16_04360 [Vicinamibacterales bacterium]